MTLEEYSKEIGADFTLEELIDSHRNLRAYYKKFCWDESRYFSEAEKKGFKAGEKRALEQEYISVQKLAGMTMLQILNLIDEVYIEVCGTQQQTQEETPKSLAEKLKNWPTAPA